MQYPIDGSCQCGQVSYQISKPPLVVMACHCRECQKLSTAPYSITVVFKSDAVRFHGELKEWSRSSESGNKNNAMFCPNCGNRIYHFNPDDDSMIRLKLQPADLADDSLFEPTMHVWVSEKKSWYQVPEGVMAIDKQLKPQE